MIFVPDIWEEARESTIQELSLEVRSALVHEEVAWDVEVTWDAVAVEFVTCNCKNRS